jgi:hypothetical protein
MLKGERDADTTKEILNAFFDINPFFGDVGNRNWHLLRQRSFESINSGDSPLKVYPETTIAVDWGADWGDGTAPLLSATAGAQLRAGAARNLQNARDRLGPETDLDVVRLGKESLTKKSVSYEVTVLGQDAKVSKKAVTSTKSTVTTYLDHASMLDDRGVQQLIQKRYEQACSTSP